MYNHLISLTWVSYTMDLQRSDQADISQFYNGYTRTASDLQGIIQYYCTTVFYNTASHITKGEGCTKHPHEIHNTFTTSVVFCNTNLETTGGALVLESEHERKSPPIRPFVDLALTPPFILQSLACRPPAIGAGTSCPTDRLPFRRRRRVVREMPKAPMMRPLPRTTLRPLPPTARTTTSPTTTSRLLAVRRVARVLALVGAAVSQPPVRRRPSRPRSSVSLAR